MIVSGVHASGRFDRRGPVLTRAGHVYRKAAPLVTHTEAGGARPDLDAPRDGWGWGQAHDAKAADECAAQWDKGVWELAVKARSFVLTNITWTRSEEYGGSKSAPTRAVVVGLRPARRAARTSLPLLWVVVSHDPLDNTALRREAWLDCQDGKARLFADLREEEPGSRIWHSADFNRSFRNRADRLLIYTQTARPNHLRSCWAGHVPPKGGTHGPMGIIDGTYTDLNPTFCCLLPDDASSDHRGYRARART